MSGGLFAMNRKWFVDSGGYDTGMEVWGGENVEMSFRVSGFMSYFFYSSDFFLFCSDFSRTDFNNPTNGCNGIRLS